jgi:hypothetical protein
MPKTTTTSKGKAFEDAVANLYRLLGAEVIQNIEICHKKVDILAHFPIHGGSLKHRVIVECKDEARAVNANQRVMQFFGLLKKARELGVADSAEIVTKVPWGDAAKGFALESGISLLTYSEKIAQLIDFRHYLNSLVNIFKKGDPARPAEPPLEKYYVDLTAELTGSTKSKRISIAEHILGWLTTPGQKRHLAVFGEYGSGKSSLCQRLAHDLAIKYRDEAEFRRIPIVLNLREFVGTIRMEAYIASFLDQECKVPNPKFEIFKAMNEAGLFFLIFDGLDEMAEKVDRDTLELNLIEIEKLGIPLKSKLMITSRPEYFVSVQEEEGFLSPRQAVIPTRQREYELLRILPWADSQIERFIQRRVPLIKEAKQAWTFYRDQIRAIDGLSDLSHRPVLLEMIVKTLPRLIEKEIPINLPNLYETYLREEMRRQKLSKRRRLLFTEDERLVLLRQLAGDVYSASIPAIAFADARQAIRKKVSPPAADAEAYTRDFLTNSFLIRKRDAYHFSHKSILEYLVAARIKEELESGDPSLMRRVLLENVVLKFLVELNVDKKRLFEWIEWTRKPSHSGARYLGGNCATLLCALSSDALIDKDLRGANLSWARLFKADLRGARLGNALLEEANLSFAKFNQQDFASVHLRNTLVSFYVWGRRSILETSLLRSGGISMTEYQLADGGFLASIGLQVNSLHQIAELKDELAKELLAPPAVYYNEYNGLLRDVGLVDQGLFP